MVAGCIKGQLCVLDTGLWRSVPQPLHKFDVSDFTRRRKRVANNRVVDNCGHAPQPLAHVPEAAVTGGHEAPADLVTQAFAKHLPQPLSHGQVPALARAPERIVVTGMNVDGCMAPQALGHLQVPTVACSSEGVLLARVDVACRQQSLHLVHGPHFARQGQGAIGSPHRCQVRTLSMSATDGSVGRLSQAAKLLLGMP